MLDGKSIIVTGAAQGIGAKFAQSFAQMGASVMLSDVADPSSAVEAITATGAQAAGCIADVSKEDDCKGMVAETIDAFGKVDGIVCNAALFTSLEQKPFNEIDPDIWDKVMAVNVKGPWLCTRAVHPVMAEHGGSIVMISTNRIVRGFPDLLHYDASKGALHAMTRSLARELGSQNIRVNTIMPGLTMSENVMAFDSIEDRAAIVAQGRSLSRNQVPGDLVGATAFFLSDHSSFITGQSLIVDGGGLVQ